MYHMYTAAVDHHVTPGKLHTAAILLYYYTLYAARSTSLSPNIISSSASSRARPVSYRRAEYSSRGSVLTYISYLLLLLLVCMEIQRLVPGTN